MWWANLLVVGSSIGPALAGPALVARQSSTKITVNPAQKYQTMDGFGFSEAFQRANLVVNLPEPTRSATVDLLFNVTTGAGFTILRNGIGSSPDSSADHMNTIEPKSPGSPSAAPTYVWDGKDSGQLWISQQAVKYGVTTIYANAWSAPGFMKTNNNDANGGSLCGVSGASCSSGDWRQAYANYLVQLMKYYQQNGVNISHVGFLNEPELSTSYASMQSSGTQAADFVKVLYPTLQSSNMSSVQIVCCEAEGWGDAGSHASQLKSAGVDNQIGVISSHSYTGAPGSPISTVHKVWQTEYADLSGSWTTTWYGSGGAGEGMTWANNVYTAVVNANCSAYLYWVATQGPSTPTAGNTNEKMILISGSTVTVSKRFWALAQWSKFVRPGAVRLGTSGGSLRTSAFQNPDGTIAVQVINQGASAAPVSISVTGVTPTAAVAWLTDNTHDMNTTTATIGTDGSVSGSVPAHAMVSFVLSQAVVSTP